MSYMPREAIDAFGEKRKRRKSDSDDEDFQLPSKSPRPVIHRDPPSQDIFQKVIRKSLDTVHKVLEGQDSYGIFAKPVTDEIAPMYSQIITRPMDLGTMRANLRRGVYTSFDQYRSDALLVADNAMIYNQPDSIFYAEAKKLREAALAALTREEQKISLEVEKELKKSASRPSLSSSSSTYSSQIKRNKDVDLGASSAPQIVVEPKILTFLNEPEPLLPHHVEEYLRWNTKSSAKASASLVESRSKFSFAHLGIGEKSTLSLHVPSDRSVVRALPPFRTASNFRSPPINARQRLHSILNAPSTPKPPKEVPELDTDGIADPNQQACLRSLHAFGQTFAESAPEVAKPVLHIIKHVLMNGPEYTDDPSRKVAELKVFAKVRSQLTLGENAKNILKLNQSFLSRKAYRFPTSGEPSAADKNLAHHIVKTLQNLATLDPTPAMRALQQQQAQQQHQTEANTAPTPNTISALLPTSSTVAALSEMSPLANKRPDAPSSNPSLTQPPQSLPRPSPLGLASPLRPSLNPPHTSHLSSTASPRIGSPLLRAPPLTQTSSLLSLSRPYPSLANRSGSLNDIKQEQMPKTTPNGQAL